MIFLLHFLFLFEEFFSNKVENTCFLQLTVTITFAEPINLLCSYKRVYLYVYLFQRKHCGVTMYLQFMFGLTHKMVKVKKNVNDKTLGLYNISKIYHHCIISIHNIHIAENCLNCNKLYSMYRPSMLCMMTIYLGNYVESHCRRWPPHRLLEAEVSNFKHMQEREEKSMRWLKERKKRKVFRGIKTISVQVIQKLQS